MSEIPEGVSVQTVWLVEATYAPDATETRVPFRPEHLAGVAGRLADGTYAMAGAYTDVSSSVLLVRAPTAEAALDLVRGDVYLRNGVWVELRARAFGLVRLAD